MKKSKTKNAAKSIAETDYLLSSPANAAHLIESIAQFKASKSQTHKLMKMTANMQAGDLPNDDDFENMPPAGRELI
jgi:hypothetical protein